MLKISEKPIVATGVTISKRKNVHISEKGDDIICNLQVPPKITAELQNIENKDIYMKLIKELDRVVPKEIHVTIAPPKKYEALNGFSFNFVTIILHKFKKRLGWKERLEEIVDLLNRVFS